MLVRRVRFPNPLLKSGFLQNVCCDEKVFTQTSNVGSFMYPKSFPSNIQSPVKKVKYICAGNQRPTLPAPHSCEPRPPVSLTSWALCITSWRHAFTLCRNKLWKFKKFCDNLRRTKGGTGAWQGSGYLGASLHRGETGSKAGAIHFKLCRGLWFFILCLVRPTV